MLHKKKYLIQKKRDFQEAENYWREQWFARGRSEDHDEADRWLLRQRVVEEILSEMYGTK